MNLTDHFLIAMPGLMDSNFNQTVTYIAEHNEHGAMGLIINRPLEISVEEMFAQLDIDATADRDVLADPLYMGGPVQEDRGFVLHEGQCKGWASSLQVTDALCVTTSRDILEVIASGKGPSNHLIALGYAGWAAGQLEQEFVQNSWLSGKADSEIIFTIPPQDRWKAAAEQLGIDLSLLAASPGHA